MTPSRLPNGYRVYSDEDIDRLRRIKSYLDTGYRISEAITLLNKASESVREFSYSSDALMSPLQDELFSALLELDRARADLLVRRGASFSYVSRLNELFFPILAHTGNLWEKGELSVAQEHFISAFCKEHLIAMLLSLGHGPESGPSVICASYEGDYHDIALLGVAIKMALNGYRVVFLGAQTPSESLLSMCEAHKPRRVCLSLTLQVEPEPLTRLVSQLRALQCEVFVGGQGVPMGLPQLEGVHWACSLNQV